MNILNIFHTGGLTLGLSLVALVLFGIFAYQAYMNYNYIRDVMGKREKILFDNERPKWYKLTHLWFAVAVVVIYVIAMLAVSSDYKGA